MSRPSPSTGSRRRWLAAPLVAGLLVLTGAPAAFAAPGAPQITAPGDGSRTDPAVELTATVGDWGGDWGGSVEFRIENADTGGGDGCVTAEQEYTAPSWSCAATLGIGDNVITAVAIAASDSSESPASAPVTITLGGTEALGVTSPADGDAIDGPFTISGVGPALGTVDVRRDGLDQCVETPIDSGGEWVCQASVEPGATSVFSVSAIRVDGSAGGDASFSISNPAGGEFERPTADYEFGPASIAVQASGPGDTEVSVDFYDVESVPEDYFEYGPSVHSCSPEGGGTESAFAVAAVQECALGDLAPGLWNVYVVAWAGEGSLALDDYVWIPESPTLSVTSSGATVRFAGTGEPASRVIARTAGGADVCSDVTDQDGAWSCEAMQSAGAHDYRAIARSVGFEVDVESIPPEYREDFGASYDGYSQYSPLRSVVVAAPPAPAPAPPAPAPVPTPTPTPFEWTFEVSGGDLHPGDAVSFTGRGAPAGSTVSAELHSTPVLLGQTVAGDDGAFRIDATIPIDVEPGDHEFVLSVDAVGRERSTISSPVAILDAAPEPSAADEVEEAEPAAERAGDAGHGGTTRNAPAAPNVLTDGVATVARVLENPIALAAAGGLAVALLFLVAIPTELLNSALSANSGRLGRGFVAVERAAHRFRDWLLRVTRSRAVAAAIVLLVVSVVFGFADPEFGVDLASLRLVLACAIALFVLSYGASWVTGLVARRAWGAESEIAIEPAIAVFAVVGVVLARLLDFSPGFLLGVVIGLELSRASRKAELGSSLVNFGVVIVLALGSWVGYSVLAGGADDFGSTLVVDTLAAVTVEGLTALAVAILPLRFLEGRDLWQASKALWLATFLVIESAFALLVLPTALEGSEVSDYGVWLLVLLAFGAVAFAVWGRFSWLERRAERRNTEQHERAGSRPPVA